MTREQSAQLLAHAAKLRPFHDIRCTPAKHAHKATRHAECLVVDLADALREFIEPPALPLITGVDHATVTVYSEHDAHSGAIVRCSTAAPAREVPA